SWPWVPAFAGTSGASGASPSKTGRRGAPLCNSPRSRLQPIQDLIGPEALEPVQRLVQAGELVGRNPADLLDRAHVLPVEHAQRLAHARPLLGQLDAHRAAVDARTLVIEEAHLDELLQVLRHV